MRITSAGDVGIGMAAPNAPLHVFKLGASTATPGGGIKMERYSNYGCAIWNEHHGSSECMNYPNRYSSATDAYGGTPQMVLAHTGYVGIGTNDPKSALHVTGAVNYNNNNTPGVEIG